jgi:hypothetical protein
MLRGDPVDQQETIHLTRRASDRIRLEHAQ